MREQLCVTVIMCSVRKLDRQVFFEEFLFSGLDEDVPLQASVVYVLFHGCLYRLVH